MKTTLCFLLALATLSSARAEIFRSGATHRPAGGQVSAHHGDGRGGWGHQSYGHYNPRGFVGYYGNPWYYGSGWGYYAPYRAPVYGYYSGYGSGYPYYETIGYGNGSYAANGLLLGALAGGIIGNNSGEFHHNGWRGAAWGAGLGWLLGTVADVNRRPVVYGSAPVMAQPTAVQVPVQSSAPAQQPQQVTIINNYYNTPMSGANALFGR